MIRIEDSLNALIAAGTVAVETAKNFADDPRLIGQAPSASAEVPGRQEATRGPKGTVRNPFAKKGS
jgi:hypothetical protein